MVPQGPAAPPDPAGGYRLRLHPGLHHLWPDRHQGLDLPGRRGKAQNDLADRGSRGDLTMLMPKKVKFRKQSRGRMRGRATRGSTLSFGEFGLQALAPCWLTARPLEAGRLTITRFIKRKGKLWIRSFPRKPVTQKPTAVRMGKGKGDPEFWVDVIRPGRT